jgi:exodeoxyribonuclease VII large subunit
MAGQLEFELKPPERRIALNVTQLVRMVRETLEVHLDQYWVTGEISNARLAPSNHLYFTLKDARSSVSAVMFKTAYRKLRFRVEDGMRVVVRGRVNLYEARGTLQFYAEEMEPRGVGALQLAFEQLKRRLAEEGLFADERKRIPPMLPRAIGIVTALGGAALRDMLRVLLDRYPNLLVIIRPALVQGAGAAADIAEAIDDLNADGRAEVIIAGRGGGSLEDLWAFNEEMVARAICRSAIPIVSAVGHEIDYTIADFAADLRAPTPTAAAQMVVPIKADLRRRIGEVGAALAAAMRAGLAAHRRETVHLAARVRDPRIILRQTHQRLEETAEGLGAAIYARLEDERRSVKELAARLRSPAALAREQRIAASRIAIRLAQAMTARARPPRLALERNSARLAEADVRELVAARRELIGMLRRRLEAAALAAIARKRMELAGRARRLDDVSPLRVLQRGYAVVTNARDGRTVADAAAVELGDEIDIRLGHGRLRANVTARLI